MLDKVPIVDGSDERVTILDDGETLRVEVTITDADVVAYAAAGSLGSDPVESIKRRIRVGVIVDTSSRLDATLEEARRMEAGLRQLSELPSKAASLLSEQVRSEIARLAGDGDDHGALAAAIDASLVRASEALAASLEPVVQQLAGAGPDAMPQLVEARIREAISKGTRQLLADVFAQDGTSPFMVQLEKGAIQVGQLDKRLRETERRLAEQNEQILHQLIRDDAAADPAASGREWEPTVLDSVSRMTAVTGDRLEITGDTPGHDRSKKGDGVIHLTEGTGISGLRVVIECRTGAKRLTVKALNQAIENRDAHAAILLTESPRALPRDAEPLGFRIYPDDRMVVAHVDPTEPGSQNLLAAALQVARALAVGGAHNPHRVHDEEAVRSALAQIQSAIAELKPIRSCATGITGEVGRIRNHADRLQRQLQDALAALSEISEAA